MMSIRSPLRALLLCLMAAPVSAQTNVGSKPYMGWSSWSLLQENPTEEKILAQADALKANNLDALGYQYINVDDGWSDGWGEDGLPRVNLKRFPHGMDGLAQAIHRRGLLFGIYLNPGIREELYHLNPLIPGTKIHIQQITDVTRAGSTRNPRHANNPDARAFRIDFSKKGAATYVDAEVTQLAKWGVDFVKLDFVGPGGGDVISDNREELQHWHRSILGSKRKMWLELSNFMSIDQAATWKATANGWRIENDIECYGCKSEANPARRDNLTEWSKVVERFRDVRPWIRFAGHGGWNDLDSLELGNGSKDGLTLAERQSMFVLWAIECAPLCLGSDLTNMDAEDLKLISNRDLIKIDQAGKPATPVDMPSLRGRADQQIWMTKYSETSAVVAIFNLGDAPAKVGLPLEELDALRDTHFAHGLIVAKDLITSSRLKAEDGRFDGELPAHGSRLLSLQLASSSN